MCSSSAAGVCTALRVQRREQSPQVLFFTSSPTHPPPNVPHAAHSHMHARTHMHACTHARARKRMHTRTHARTRTHTYTHACARHRMCTCMHARTHAHGHTRAHMHTYAHTHARKHPPCVYPPRTHAGRVAAAAFTVAVATALSQSRPGRVLIMHGLVPRPHKLMQPLLSHVCPAGVQDSSGPLNTLRPRLVVLCARVRVAWSGEGAQVVSM